MILELAASIPQISSTKSFLRPLGSFEELLWQMDKRSPLHAILVAHVDGITHIDQWEAALEQTRLRHPLWSSQITEGGDGRPFFETDHESKVALRVVEGAFLPYWEQEVAWELSRSISSTSGSLVRAVLLHTDESCVLILVAHHSICDGMSLAFAIRDVLSAISGVKLIKLGVPPSQENALGMCLQTKARACEVEHRLEPLLVISAYRRSSSAIPEVCSHELSEAFTETLRKRAREEKTSVHAALIAASGLVARQDPDYGFGRELNICSPINNRKLIGYPENSGVFFTASDVAVPVDCTETFWNLARSSKATVSKMQTLEGVRTVLDAVNRIVQSPLDATATAEEGGRLFRCDVMVTNLGAVPIPSAYGRLTLRQLWGPGALIGLEGEQTLGVSTFNGRLSLLHMSHTPLPGFLDDITAILHSACGS